MDQEIRDKTMRVTVTYSITYNLSPRSSVGREYRQQLDDHKDTKSQRRWFVIDRFIGHHNIKLIDQKAALTIKEEN